MNKSKQNLPNYKVIFKSIIPWLITSFINVVMIHTLMRDNRKFITGIYFRQFPEIEKTSKEFDKNTYMSILRGFFVLFWIISLIYIYYQLLLKYFGNINVYYAFNFLVFLIMFFWELNYVIIGDSQTILPRNFLIYLANFSTIATYVLANLHIGFITGFLENIGPFFITIYWGYVSYLINRYCKNKSERQELFTSISLYSSYGHILTVGPLLTMLLSGFVAVEQITALSYRIIYLLLFVNVFTRYQTDLILANLDVDYLENTKNMVVQNSKENDSDFSKSITVIQENPMLTQLFFSNLIYFTMASLIENLTGSLIVKLANTHYKNLVNNNTDILNLIFTFLRKNCKDRHSNHNDFRKAYINSVVQILNLTTSFLTGASSWIVSVILKWFYENVEQNNYICNLLSSDNPKYNKVEKGTIFSIKSLITIGIIEFAYCSAIYLEFIDVSLFGLLQMFFAMGFIRGLKYNQLDNWRQEIYISCLDSSIKNLATAGVDMYSPRIAKSVVLSSLTLTVDTILQLIDTNRLPGAYNYEHSIIYLPVYCLLGNFYLNQHKYLLSLIKTEEKKFNKK